MDFKAIGNAIATTSRMVGGKIWKHSPTILVVAGSIGVTVGAVMACKATLKVNEVLESTNNDLERIHDIHERIVNDPDCKEASQYSEEDYRRDLVITYSKAALNLGKLYGPSLAVGALSIISIFASHNILSGRHAASLAACATTEKIFSEYRRRVVDDLGRDADMKYRYGIHKEEVEIPEIDKKGNPKLDKDGNPKVKKETRNVIDDFNPNQHSEFARLFDELSTEYEKDSEYNKHFLLCQQNLANQKLKTKGYLFLNEVYEALGLLPSRAGQAVGWVYEADNVKGDNYVDFGIFDVYPGDRSGKSAFINGAERAILLDFNVDGNILDRVWGKHSKR